MENFHDVGGQPSGSITKVDRELSWWEKRVDAIILYLVEKRIVLLDELRCATEELEPVEYERLRHYERNIIILEKLLVEKGFLSRTMLDRKFNERRAQERGFSGSPQRTHTHEHASDHGTSEYEWRIDAIQEILVQEGICTVDDIHRGVEDMDARGEALGGRIVAKAWTDPVFTRRLLADAKAAISELNIDTGTLTTLVALQNTERLHHLVVCTLCSCYPRAILGIPPDWYKSKAYRARAVRDPRGVLREFGLYLDVRTVVHVVDSTAEIRYFVIPTQPPGTEGMSEEGLAGLVSRDSLIGAAQARLPRKDGSRTTTEPLS